MFIPNSNAISVGAFFVSEAWTMAFRRSSDVSRPLGIFRISKVGKSRNSYRKERTRRYHALREDDEGYGTDE